MATSIHVYDDIETFNHVYKGWLLEPLKNVKIKDMYIYDKKKLWVVTNTNDQKEQPRLQHSLVHFRNGNIYGYQDEKTKLVLHDKVKFNQKKLTLEFFPKFLRKPDLSWRIGRYWTNNNPKKSKKIDWDLRFYDFELDRINLILSVVD